MMLSLLTGSLFWIWIVGRAPGWGITLTRILKISVLKVY